MRSQFSRILAHVWLTIGVLAIVGSILGGLALSLDRGRGRPATPPTPTSTANHGTSQ
jgi:hypothetical protein